MSIYYPREPTIKRQTSGNGKQMKQSFYKGCPYSFNNLKTKI